MTARLVFLAFVGLTGAIIYNALYLQDLHGTVAVTAPSWPEAAKPANPPAVELVKLPPVKTDLPPIEPGNDGKRLLVKAVQRELATRGYDVGTEDGKPSEKTQAAISLYEKSHGMPVTGTATDALLRHILLGDSAHQPAGATGSVKADAADDKAKGSSNVKAVQQVLADLGYEPGAVDGALGSATTHAIIAFQKDRKIAQTGRITPALLAELKRVTGRDLTKLAAGH